MVSTYHTPQHRHQHKSRLTRPVDRAPLVKSCFFFSHDIYFVQFNMKKKIKHCDVFVSTAGSIGNTTGGSMIADSSPQVLAQSHQVVFKCSIHTLKIETNGNERNCVAYYSLLCCVSAVQINKVVLLHKEGLVIQYIICNVIKKNNA